MEQYQEIAAICIVVAAFLATGYKLLRHIFAPAKGCSGCVSDCSGCQLQDLKAEIERNKKKAG